MFKPLCNGLLLLAALTLMSVACCNEPTFDYLNLRQLDLSLSEAAPGSPAFAPGARTSAPELRLAVRPAYDYLAAAPAGGAFVGAALALSCPDDSGRKGLKDKVAAVAFTSTGRFAGVPAGQPLQQFVRVSEVLSRSGKDFPLAQLADSLNMWKGGKYETLNYPFALLISPKPTDNAEQKFELRITLQSGKEIVQTTPTIFWD